MKDYDPKTHFPPIEYSQDALWLAQAVYAKQFERKLRYQAPATVVYLGRHERKILETTPVPGVKVDFHLEPFIDPPRVVFHRQEPPEWFLLGLKVIPVDLPTYCQIGVTED